MMHLISNVLKFFRNTINSVALEPKILTKKNFFTTKNMSAQGSDYIVWVDLEMSGLNIEKDHILEMACLITDKNLNMVAERSEIIIKQADSVLDGMDEWCTNTHGKSGLTQAVKDSQISLEMAETIMLEFLQKHVPPKTCPLAGNSIYMDRMFLNKYMKRFNDYLHYRIIDVSTIKELNFRWYSENKNLPRKKLNHRALDDIKESIAELKFYRETIFKSQIKDN